MANDRVKLAIVTSHPIQYQVPWFRALARETDLTVFYCHRQDAGGQADAGYGVHFEWDVPLLDGYHHHWLSNVSQHPNVSSFRGCDTPEIAGLVRGFDACIVSGWYLKSYLQAIQGCRKAGVPVLVRGDSQLTTRRSRVVSAAKYFPYRWLLTHVDGHLYVGHSNRDYLRHYGVEEHKLFFVPHFVDNDFFRSRADEARRLGSAAEIRRAAGATPATTLFAFVGRLVESKRVEDFVRALALGRADGSDLRGLIVGAGPLMSDLQNLTNELGVPVSFVGFRNQTELPAHLAAADALVLPSASETWGLVVNEAMACGLPVVVSRAVGCARDLVMPDETGQTFELGDISGFVRGMQMVHSRLQGDSRAFRESVASRIAQYSVDTAARNTIAAVRTVAERAKGAWAQAI